MALCTTYIGHRGQNIVAVINIFEISIKLRISDILPDEWAYWRHFSVNGESTKIISLSDITKCQEACSNNTECRYLKRYPPLFGCVMHNFEGVIVIS